MIPRIFVNKNFTRWNINFKMQRIFCKVSTTMIEDDWNSLKFKLAKLKVKVQTPGAGSLGAEFNKNQPYPRPDKNTVRVFF